MSEPRPRPWRKPPLRPYLTARLRNLVLDVLTLLVYLLVIAAICGIGYVYYETGVGLQHLGE